MKKEETTRVVTRVETEEDRKASVGKYICEIYPQMYFTTIRKPNLWARFWWFFLFGARVRKIK